MLQRLKSLPLTIVLTILIWMYAESQVNSSHGEDHLTIPNIPVWVSGPPDKLAQYEVSVNPTSVSVKVVGTTEQIDALRHESPIQGVYAYVAITPDDYPAGIAVSRQLQLDLPPGVTPAEPVLVSFRMTAKSTASAASGP